MRTVACLFAFGLLIGLCGRMAAEETSWASDESKIKELRLTLTSGEVVQGKYAADTDDKVMLSVVTPKGKNMQTIKKEDVKKREWVQPLEDEFRDKLMKWPADKFEDMQTYAQEMINKGFKKVYLDAMKDKQKDLTAKNFKLYAYLLLNNDCEQETKDLISWAKQEHPDWKDDIADVVDRLPKANLLTDPGVTGPTATAPTALAPGQMPCSGKVPNTKETEKWLEDAKKHLPEAAKVEFTAYLTYDQTDPSVIIMDVAAQYEPKVTGGKGVKYGVGLVYTRRSPGVFAYKDMVIMTWAGFPHPNAN